MKHIPDYNEILDCPSKFLINTKLNQRLSNMSSYNESILLNTTDAGNFFEGGWGKSFQNQWRNERGVFEPQAKAIWKNIEASFCVEVTILGWYWRLRCRWAKGLVEFLRRWLRGGDKSGWDGFSEGFIGYVVGSERKWGGEEWWMEESRGRFGRIRS